MFSNHSSFSHLSPKLTLVIAQLVADNLTDNAAKDAWFLTPMLLRPICRYARPLADCMTILPCSRRHPKENDPCHI